MSVYVDSLFNYGWHWGENCHLTADDLELLKSFGLSIGLKLKWMNIAESGIPYFNLTFNKRELAIKKGAIEISVKVGVGWKSFIEKPKPPRIIKFRPLRKIKKTGKITVTSYMGWNKLRTADYNKFHLVINDEYKTFANDEYVYDHNGQSLFFFNYNPANIPVYNSRAESIKDEDWLDKLHDSKKFYGIRWSDDDLTHTNYRADGMDCAGTPTFSHWNEDRITEDDTWKYYGHDKFVPLTVGIVKMWFGWFLYQLNNSYLQIEKK